MRPNNALILSLLAFVIVGCASAPVAQKAQTGGGANAYNVLGRADAPVSIVEFSDLQCPYCARFALQTFPEVRRNYIDTGKVRYGAKDFPLPFHAYAFPAAVAVRCAGEQGRFWEYREALFAMQNDLPSAPYDSLAATLKLDVPRFTACRTDGKVEASLRTDMDAARASGISSTPTFLIGRLVDGKFQGETFSGAEPYAKFAERIETELAAAK